MSAAPFFIGRKDRHHVDVQADNDEETRRRSARVPERDATIESLPVAIEVVKAMQAQGLDWGRAIARLAVGRWPRLSRRRMAAAVDRWLESLEAEDAADRRSGYYRRLLLTELSDIELLVRARAAIAPQRVVVQTLEVEPSRSSGA